VCASSSNPAPNARSILHDAVAEGTGDLVLRAGALEIGDSTGLGVIVGVGRRARRVERRLVLSGVRPREARLLRATRLSRTLTMEAGELVG
jgi:anti-anti-sigma factor